MRYLILTVLVLCGLGLGELKAQMPEPVDTSKNDQVLVDFADLFEYIQGQDSTIQKLLGNVELRQDSVFMYCDSAIILNETDVIAMGNVVIQQGDSISVFADSLAYDGEDRIADLFGNVVLLSGESQKLYTDVLRYNLGEKLATYETGALLTNDTTQLTSVRGYYYLQTDDVYFRDSVQVVSPDFELKSDTLKFNTRTQQATFLGPTLITEELSKIYCEGGYYKVRENQALFTDNPQYLKEESGTKATADSIKYDGNIKEVSLMGNARFEESDKLATADVLRYDEVNDISYLEGNAVYIEENQEIRSDTLTYDQRNEVYKTRGRSFVSDPPQLIEADQLDYDQSRGLGIALGNVVWQDTSADLSILCAQADYDEDTDYLKAFGGRKNRPMLITIMDGDSLFLTADTLIAFRPTPGIDSMLQVQPISDTLSLDSLSLDSLISIQPKFENLTTDARATDSVDLVATISDTLTIDSIDIAETGTDTLLVELDSLIALQPANETNDSSRILIAFNDVRILKSNLQAICDSLSYSTVDSLFRLYQDPMIWSDTSQFKSDTVFIQLANDKIDQILLRKNALILNSPDELFFNQIKGKYITAFMEDQDVRRMDVDGSAESIYYSLDEAGAYMGLNKTLCSEMSMFFNDGQVEKIKFYNNPEGEFVPMEEADHQGKNLWKVENRPFVLDDLFKEKKLPSIPPASDAAQPGNAPDKEEKSTPALPPKPRN